MAFAAYLQVPEQQLTFMLLKLFITLLFAFSLQQCLAQNLDFEPALNRLVRKNLGAGDTVITYRYPPFILISPSDSIPGIGLVQLHQLAYIIEKKKNKITFKKLLDYFQVYMSQSTMFSVPLAIEKGDSVFTYISQNLDSISRWSKVLPPVYKFERDNQTGYEVIYGSDSPARNITITTADTSFSYDVSDDAMAPGYGHNYESQNLNYQYNKHTAQGVLYNMLDRYIDRVENYRRFK